MGDLSLRHIIVLATLDTKGLEARFLRDRIIHRGFEAILVDTGLLGDPGYDVDVTRSEVARAAGWEISDLVREALDGKDRMPLTSVMGEGAASIVSQLYGEGKVAGIVGLGGSTGMAIAARAMHAVPLGIPKLLVGTHFYPQYLGEADLAIIQCPADILGLNPITTRCLSQAAGAICGMVGMTHPFVLKAPLVAVSCLGVTTPGVMELRRVLEERGYDVVTFHANSEIMDHLAQEGILDGVIDFSPNELMRIFVLKETPWRSHRLEPAGNKGIPVVIVPGSLDMLVLRTGLDRLPTQYQDRKISSHGPHITLVRSTKSELLLIAEIVSKKALMSTGPLAMVYPERGFSSVDVSGGPFFEPETDREFLEGVRRGAGEKVWIEIMDAHIFDPQFVRRVVDVYELLRGGSKDAGKN